MMKTISLNIMKLLNMLSLIFLSGNMLLLFVIEGDHHGFLFLWSLLCSVLSYVIKAKGKFFFASIVPWVGFPAVLQLPDYQVAYLAAVGSLVLVILRKNFEDVDYAQSEKIFMSGLFLGAGFLFTSLLFWRLKAFSDYAAGYMMIYVISGVFILRSLRFLQYSHDYKKCESINRKALAFILMLSVVISSNAFITLLGKAFQLLSGVYVYLVKIILTIIIVPLSYLAKWFYNGAIWFLGLFELNEMTNGSELDGNLDPDQIFETTMHYISSDNMLFRLLLVVFTTLFVFYLLYRVYARHSFISHVEECFIENKEILLPQHGRKIWLGIMDRMTPKTREEKIRAYYKEFLAILQKRGVVILPSDTTEDIHIKAQSFYASDSLSFFRDVYCVIRYRNSTVDTNTYNKFKHIYKRMKKEDTLS
ncbi:MAG: hypothetical protein Q8S24_03025 [Eubacteriales bacterium]|nr:hypothetical protein [Eubacteriales bacterium]